MKTSKIILLAPKAPAGYVSVEGIRNGVAVYNCDSEGKHLPLPDPTDPYDYSLLDEIEDWGVEHRYESERQLACACLALQKWGII